MPLESIICRRKLDSEYGNEWLCQCFRCRDEREEIEKKNICKTDTVNVGKPKTEEANLLNPGEGLDMAGEDISSPGASCAAARSKRVHRDGNGGL